MNNNTPPVLLNQTTISAAIDDAFPALTADSEKKSTWEDVDSIYSVCAEGIITILEFIQNTSQVFEADISGVEPRVVTAIRSLTRDLDELSKALLRIRGNHANYSGEINNDLEHKLSIDIMQDYIGFQERFQVAVLTPMTVITEGITEFQAKQAAKNAEPVETPAVN